MIWKSDNLALQESSSKTRNFAFLPDKGFMNEMDRSQRHVRKKNMASKNVCSISTVEVSQAMSSPLAVKLQKT